MCKQILPYKLCKEAHSLQWLIRQPSVQIPLQKLIVIPQNIHANTHRIPKHITKRLKADPSSTAGHCPAGFPLPINPDR